MAKLTKLTSRISTISSSKTASIVVKRSAGSGLTKTRKRIAIRDGYTCQMCGRVVAVFEIDHKVPLFFGGSDSDENRQLLCIDCHKKKSDEETKMRGN